jgi:hypothetical protein
MTNIRRLLLVVALAVITAVAVHTAIQNGWLTLCDPICQADTPTSSRWNFVGQDLEAEPEPTDAAQIILDAPMTCEVGELVRLDLRDSTLATTLVVLTVPELNAVETDFEIIDNGRRAFFSSRGAGEYLIIVAGAKNDQPYLAYRRLTVVGDPTDSTPRVKSLTTIVAEFVRRVQPYEHKDDRGTVLASRKIHGDALAGIFRQLSTSSDVAVDGMLEATALANSAVLGKYLQAWMPFLDGIGTILDEYDNDGLLTTRESYAKVWREIAAGIERGL